MRKFFLLCSVAFLSLMLHAQVDNYALKFDGTGSVNCGQLQELDGIGNFTIQFWINPEQWVDNAYIYRVGETGSLSAKLGTPGNLVLTFGQKSITASSNALKAGFWAQISIIKNNTQLKVLINNIETTINEENVDIPSSVATSNFILGENYKGCLDEFRIWKTSVGERYLMWQNTLNEFHPDYADLVAYYKLDQKECSKMVDYTFKYHGTLIGGVVKEKVTDNDKFKYKVVTAYTNFTRYFDRPNIQKENYLMANDLIILDMTAYEDGHARMNNPANDGVIANGRYLNEFEGRTGVLALNGNGAKMDVGPDALAPEDAYSFATWIYLDEWTPGAFIIKKEKSDTQGFSVRLGDEAENEVIVRLDGTEFKISGTKSKLTTKKWMNFGVIANSTSLKYPQEIFRFVFDGSGAYPTVYPQIVEKDYKIENVSDVNTIIGENLKAKFDETIIWHKKRTVADVRNEMNNGLRVPTIGNSIEEDFQFYVNSYWKYDYEQEPGRDSYSYKEFIRQMRKAYEGRTGYNIRFGLRSSGNWQSMVANSSKRATLVEDIARIIEENDIAGIETDLEWAYSDYDVTNYSNLIAELKARMPDRIISSSPHAVCYNLKRNALDAADRFSFQVYTNRDLFTMDSYKNAYNSFKNFGYPNSKIVMSYGATSSWGDNNSPENGYVSLIGFDPRPDVVSIKNPNTQVNYNVCSFNQVWDRAQYVRDQDLAGLMYWDMGNDLPATEELSLCRAANFALSSNVDLLVTDENIGSIVSIEKNETKTTKNQLFVYPNPAKGEVTMRLAEGMQIDYVEIYDMLGRRVDYISGINLSETRYTLPSSMQGNYIVKVKSTEGSSYIRNLIVL